MGQSRYVRRISAAALGLFLATAVADAAKAPFTPVKSRSITFQVAFEGTPWPYVAKPLGFPVPSPVTNAVASTRASFRTIFPINQVSTSNPEVSSNFCVTGGCEYCSCKGIR